MPTATATAQAPSLRAFYSYRFFASCLPYLPVASVCFLARGLSVPQVMALGTVYCLGVAALGVPLAVLADRRGLRGAMIAGSLALLLGCALAASARGLGGLVLAQLVLAVAGALDGGSDSAYLHALLGGDAYRAAESRLTTVRLLGNVVGFALGGLLAGCSPALPFVAGMGCALLAGAAALRLRPVAPAAAAPVTADACLRGVGQLLSAPGRRRYLLLSALMLSLGRVASTTVGPLLESRDVPVAAVGLCTAAGAALGALGAHHAGALARRVGEHALLLLLPVLLLLDFVLLGTGRGGRAVLALCLLPQVLSSVHGPLWRAHLLGRLGRTADRATVLALDGAFARVAYALFSGLLGVVAADGGAQGSLRAGALLGAVILLGIALFPPRARPVWALAVAGAFVLLCLPRPARAAEAAAEADEAARLCAQPITSLKVNPRGTTIKFKAVLGDGTRVSLRPAQRNEAGYFRADVAAYHLARALGVGAVPPACLRPLRRADLLAAARGTDVEARVDREVLFDKDGETAPASAVLWLDGVRPATLDEEETSRLRTWDFLIANWDRWSGGNTFRAGAAGPAVWLDNAAGFGSYSPPMRRRNEAQLLPLGRFSRSLIDTVRALPEHELAAALQPSGLSQRELRDVLSRREALLRRVDHLIEAAGEERVLAFK